MDVLQVLLPKIRAVARQEQLPNLPVGQTDAGGHTLGHALHPPAREQRPNQAGQSHPETDEEQLVHQNHSNLRARRGYASHPPGPRLVLLR